MVASPAPLAPPRLAVSPGGKATAAAGNRRLCTSMETFFAWVQRRYRLVDKLAAVPDGRDAARTEIPLAAILLAVLAMFWVGLKSMRALDDRLRVNAGLRRVLSRAGWPEGISDDTFADALDRLGLDALRGILHGFAKRELKRWRAGRYKTSELARRLRGVGGSACTALVVRIVVAIDGHELFSGERRHCDHCLTRQVRKKREGKEVKVTEYYHKVVTAQWVGVHPAPVLDFEPVQPGEEERGAAKRLVKRLSAVFGRAIGTLLTDALYDEEPFRKVVRDAGYSMVVRHKDKRREPGRTCKARLDQRDPGRAKPDRRHWEASTRRRYECWDEPELADGTGRRYVEACRTDKDGKVHKGGCVTDLPQLQAPATAVAMLMETRWWIEDTGYHELAGEWNVDRPFVHSGRPTAAMAIATLALMAYDALQAYVYRELGLDPAKPQRTIGDIKGDLRETLVDFGRRATARAP